MTIPATSAQRLLDSLPPYSGGVLSNIATPFPFVNGVEASAWTFGDRSFQRQAQIAPSGSQTLRTGSVALTLRPIAGLELNGARVVSALSSDAAFEKYTGIYTPTEPGLHRVDALS